MIAYVIHSAVWLVAVLSAVFGAASLIHSSWVRYQANPTVISLEKDYRTWNVPFPAATLCYMNRVNITRANTFIQSQWGTVNKVKKEYYMRFLEAVTNISYRNLERFREFDGDTTLTEVSMEEIIEKVGIDLSYITKWYAQDSDLDLYPVMTEMGLCYSSESPITQMFQELRKQDLGVSNSPPIKVSTCNVLKWQCYGRITELASTVQYFIHSPYELPDCTSKAHKTSLGYESESSFWNVEIISSPELRRLHRHQRKCQFFDERDEHGPPVYSNVLCKMKCRRRQAVRLCGCAPYFYSFLGKGKICNVSGLICLSRYASTLIQLVDENSSEKISCQCYHQCNEISYVPNGSKYTYLGLLGSSRTQFYWSIARYSRTRYKREIIYSFEDLLVSLGGIAALFLGCSLMSGVELVYFFTLRLCCILVNKRRIRVSNTSMWKKHFNIKNNMYIN